METHSPSLCHIPHTATYRYRYPHRQKALAISQPAVSRSVKQLETALGTKLFIRAAKGVCLTPEGELLYRYVAKGYEQITLRNHILYFNPIVEPAPIYAAAHKQARPHHDVSL